jgi:hypothetical protein
MLQPEGRALLFLLNPCPTTTPLAFSSEMGCFCEIKLSAAVHGVAEIRLQILIFLPLG